MVRVPAETSIIRSLRIKVAQDITIIISFRIKNEELKSAESKLKVLRSQPTNEEAEHELTELEVVVKCLEERLAKLSSQQNLVSKEEKEIIERNHEIAVKEWRKRKRMCCNVMDAILENCPKSKQSFIEDVGIETDEEAGAKVPDI